MDFTPLHRILGREPGPLTSEMLDEAVAQGVGETSDLDWKSGAPPPRELKNSDFPKDVAAMANIGGGMLVYGVQQDDRAQAACRVDIGDIPETYTRTMGQVAISSISPPVFNLRTVTLQTGGVRSLVVLVPTTADGPHLIFRGEYFGAPSRSGPDTYWLREQELERMYRSRFEARHAADTALDDLFEFVSASHPADSVAWIVAVARPVLSGPLTTRLRRSEVQVILDEVRPRALELSVNNGLHPLEHLDLVNLRPGLRSWLAVPQTDLAWREAWASVHDDGSTTLSAAVGGQRLGRDAYAEGWQVDTGRAEAVVADFMSIVLVTGSSRGVKEYAVRIGLEWQGSRPLELRPLEDWANHYVPLRRFSPVTRSVRVDVGGEGFLSQVRDIATDVVNQGGVPGTRTIR